MRSAAMEILEKPVHMHGGAGNAEHNSTDHIKEHQDQKESLYTNLNTHHMNKAVDKHIT